ncbi:hypothetical protein F5883DRAFT_512601 [Diaporthe sp. PMI_573]|nr:hypothetical protein F5883DRAFT_512601 [Diaporthaceae sp. PMI_573]
MFSFQLLLFTLAVLLRPETAAARTITNRQVQSQPRTVFQFANGTWVENIAVRRNGDLLVTLIDRPELYLINPQHGGATRIGDFEDAKALSLMGISEMAPDVFAVIAGNYSISSGMSTPKSYSVWQVDFNRGGRCDKISEIEGIPEASFLNGMTTLEQRKDSVLISDSTQGVVWRVDAQTGDYEIVLEDETMKPIPGVPSSLGINGIRILGDYVYYVNAFRGLFCRVKIDLSTGAALGPFEVLATNVTGDDLTFSKEGIAYVAENTKNSLVRIGSGGETSLVAGGLNSTLIPGPTSAAFGRRKSDQNTIYVTTSGGQIAPVNGTYTEGGKVMAFDVGN